MEPDEALRIADRRRRTQRLTGPPFESPEDVVGWLGGVQSQGYDYAKWSLGQRSHHADDALVEKAVSEGTILRTHVLRPTWHFVLPEDIRWMLELTGPRVMTSTRSYYSRLGLDAAARKKANARIEKALRGGNQLTRKELKVVLEKAGIEVDNMRLGFIMGQAELTGLICSGARQGKQHTYALLSERAPDAAVLDPDDALRELTARYFTSHGPATVKDFNWWSSLRMGDIRKGIEMAGTLLRSEVVAGTTFWFGDSPRVRKARSLKVDLLQPYDEYFVAYTESRGVIDASGRVAKHRGRPPAFFGAVMVDGQFSGHWRRKTSRAGVLIEVELYAPFDEIQTKALHDEADRLGRFFDRPVSPSRCRSLWERRVRGSGKRLPSPWRDID